MDEIINQVDKTGNTISESASLFTPFYQEEAIKFIKNESVNFKLITNQLELTTKNALLSEDNKKIILENENDKVVILLEDFISNEIDNYIRRI